MDKDTVTNQLTYELSNKNIRELIRTCEENQWDNSWRLHSIIDHGNEETYTLGDFDQIFHN